MEALSTSQNTVWWLCPHDNAHCGGLLQIQSMEGRVAESASQDAVLWLCQNPKTQGADFVYITKHGVVALLEAESAT